MSRVVVIGAGMGGLAAAARLSALGHDVTVLESGGRTGGKVATYSRDGFAFDTGPSLFTLPAVYRDLFLKTGRGATAPLEANVELLALQTAFNYRFGDGSAVALPGFGVGPVSAALGNAFGERAEQDWKRLMARAAAVWGLTRDPILQSPLAGRRSLLRLARSAGDVRTVAPFTSLRGLGSRYLSDERLRVLLDRYATYTGSDPRQAPAALVTVPYVEQTFGAWHIGGGIGRLAEALTARVAELGVGVHLSTPVAEVLLDGSKVSGVRTEDDRRIPADIVVSDADASRLYGSMLPSRVSRAPLRRLHRATPSLSGFVLLLAVRGQTPGVQHHNVWFPENYDDEFDSIFGRAPRPVPDPAIYACVPDDPAMRPDGHEAWFILVNAPRHDPGRGVDWCAPGVADRYADTVLDRLAQRGMDLRDRLLWREIRTPADLQADTGAPGGSIYGTSSNGKSAAFLRPANASPVPGLFLVGGSAHPGGGLPLVGMSAEIVSGLIGPA
jgi:phytoene desaturase